MHLGWLKKLHRPAPSARHGSGFTLQVGSQWGASIIGTGDMLRRGVGCASKSLLTASLRVALWREHLKDCWMVCAIPLDPPSDTVF